MNQNILWQNFLEVLRSKINEVSYMTWFKDTKLLSQNNGKLVIEVPMPIHKKFLNESYYDLIDEIITEITGNSYDLDFVIEEEKEQVINQKQEEVIYKNTNSNLLTKYKFNNFVVGDSNRNAHAVALAVAEQPGRLYNPLFIYGKSGLGKTHLMHAIGNYIVENSEKSVLYVTSDNFISDFIEINNKTENNIDFIQHFKDKYRNIDVLIIDDIQFLKGADKTQQEFFHTFNNLHDSNKQIIISSDRSPDDLKFLEDRLRTRFRWGLTVDIYPPDYNLKCKLLRDKMAGLEIEKYIKPEVIEYIATNCDNDVRAIEGSVNRLQVYTVITGVTDITLEFAIEALKDYIGKSMFTTNNITKIQKAIAEHYKITIDDLKSKKRTAHINYPRQIAMYLCKMTTEETLVKIGLEFGNRDHSTVIHSCEKIEEEVKKNDLLKDILEEIKNKIVN